MPLLCQLFIIVSIYFQTAHLSHNRRLSIFLKTALRKYTKLPDCGVYDEGDCMYSELQFQIQGTDHKVHTQFVDANAK